MNIRWARVALATLIGEIVPIALLFATVAAFGPRDPFGAAMFADAAGHWIGPLAGATAALVAGFWVARPLATGAVKHGFLVGTALALLDTAILVASQAPFEWLLVISNLGKILAATAGGLFVAWHRRTPVAVAAAAAKR